MGVTARQALTIAPQREKPWRRTTWPGRDPANRPRRSGAPAIRLIPSDAAPIQYSARETRFPCYVQRHGGR